MPFWGVPARREYGQNHRFFKVQFWVDQIFFPKWPGAHLSWRRPRVGCSGGQHIFFSSIAAFGRILWVVADPVWQGASSQDISSPPGYIRGISSLSAESTICENRVFRLRRCRMRLATDPGHPDGVSELDGCLGSARCSRLRRVSAFCVISASAKAPKRASGGLKSGKTG